MRDMTMTKVNKMYVRTLVLLSVVMISFYSCGTSSPNTNATTVSSAFAKIVTCPMTVAPVAISNFTFQPSNSTIAINDIVKWTNNDSIDHTVTSGPPGSFDGKFDSGHITPNATVCVQFLAAGSYAYFCNIHTFMTGTVTVQ